MVTSVLLGIQLAVGWSIKRPVVFADQVVSVDGLSAFFRFARIVAWTWFFGGDVAARRTFGAGRMMDVWIG